MDTSASPRPSRSQRVAVIALGVFVVTSFVLGIMELYGANPADVESLDNIIGTLFAFTSAVVFVVAHAMGALGWKRSLIFYAVVGVISLPAEYVGVSYGWIFGSYVYIPREGDIMLFGKIPLYIPIFWVLFIYFSFMAMLGLMGGHLAKKGIIRWPWWRWGGVLVGTGLLTVTLDMLADPVSIMAGAWKWLNPGMDAYFGIPLTNFGGWFLVTGAACAVYLATQRFVLQWKVAPTRWFALTPTIFYAACVMRGGLYLAGHGKGAIAMIVAVALAPFLLWGLMGMGIAHEKEHA